MNEVICSQYSILIADEKRVLEKMKRGKANGDDDMMVVRVVYGERERAQVRKGNNSIVLGASKSVWKKRLVSRETSLGMLEGIIVPLKDLRYMF